MACKTCAGRDKKNCLECGPGPTRPSAEEIAKARGIVAQYKASRRDEFAKIAFRSILDARIMPDTAPTPESIAARMMELADAAIRELDAPRSAATDEESDQGDSAADEK